MRVSGRLVGLWRGHEVDADVHAECDGDALRFEAVGGGTTWRLPLARLDGLAEDSTHARFYVAGGDVLELDGDDRVGALARRARDAACVMPEITRDLRALGTAAFADPADATLHDAWFGPFLDARRAAQSVTDPARQVALADAPALARRMDDVIARLAATHADGAPPRERAIAARLEDATAPVHDALAELALSGDAARVAEADSQLAEWRRWVAAFARVMRAVDGAWPLVRVAVRV